LKKIFSDYFGHIACNGLYKKRKIMDKGKEATLYILEQYRSHCQTTVDMGDNADKENLKEVKKAIKWVKAQ
jgi:hypothetical protein